MTRGGAVMLMYHELEVPGEPTANQDPGYFRYVVSAHAFRQHLNALREADVTVQKLDAMLKGGTPADIIITFDDGAETDLTAAAPLLAEFGYPGCFYIVADWVSRRGFLSAAQLRELASNGFEIGSHSSTHRYLSDLDEKSLEDEVAGSKHKLEDLLGQSVDHFSCPGGRWNQRVVRAVQRAGYRSMAISRTGKITRPIQAFALNRIAVLRSTPARAIRKFALGKGLWKRQALENALRGAKAMLGNSPYDQLRSLALRKGQFRK